MEHKPRLYLHNNITFPIHRAREKRPNNIIIIIAAYRRGYMRECCTIYYILYTNGIFIVFPQTRSRIRIYVF